MQLLKALSASRMFDCPLFSAEYPFDQKGLKSDVEVRAKLARDQMSVLEDIQKSLGGSTATGKKKTQTDAEKLELDGTEKLVSEAKAEFLKAVQKPFDLIRQLLIGEALNQW